MKKEHLKPKQNLALLFRKALMARYEFYRISRNEKNGLEHFLQYLITHQLIEPITIQRYTILYAFQEQFEQNDFHKTNTVKVLAKQFNLSERQIWTILKTHTQRFRTK